VSEGRWIDLGEGVYARRYEELDLTVGLVAGSVRCLVIDTRGDVTQGGEWATAVRGITAKPWTIVYTHAHFDHCFGTTAFLPGDVWAHENCRAELAAHGAKVKKHRADFYREQGEPTLADNLERTAIELPDRLFARDAELDLGDRRVVLTHPGKAHTDHDVLVHIPDAGVVFAGDVIENGPSGFTAESFGSDTDLAAWPAALTAIEALDARVVVPGHGEPVSPAFVAAHRNKLTELVALCARVHSGELSEREAITRSPYPEDVTRAALQAPHEVNSNRHG
jgi:glyoxylase-like metal-dependent hydrolase (beta-lactamase superfamily II)